MTDPARRHRRSSTRRSSPLPARRRSDRPALTDGDQATRSPAWSHVDLRRVRRTTDAGVLPLVPRSASRAGRDSPAHPTGRGDVLASDVQRAVREIDPCCRSTTSARWTSTSRRTCSCGGFRHACSSSRTAAARARRPSASTPSSVTRSRSARTEIGIRIAMGAMSNRVVKQIVKEGLIVVSAGLILAWVMAAMVQAHLFSAGPGAWTVLTAVPALLFGVAALACWLPARRATMVDPVVALRSE